MRMVKRVLGALAPITAGACLERLYYDVAIRNVTPGDIYGAHVTYGDVKSVGSSMSPGIFKIHGDVTEPLPENATVEWRTPDKVQHQQVVAVRSP